MLNDTEKRLKVAIYIRVSTKNQEEKYSIPHQENSIKRYIEARDRQLELADKKYMYYDRISGASDIEERKGLNKLFNDLKLAREMKIERPFDMVIVYRIDRFARKVKVLLNIVDSLQSYGVDFASCYESIDTSTAFGKAMLQIMGVFAELERDMITTKTHSGLREKKRAGGRAQEKYGYLRDHKHFPQIYEPEAKVIHDIFKWFVYEDLTIAQICKRLEEKKVKNPTFSLVDKIPNKPTPKRVSKGPYFWNDRTVRDKLKDELYIGKFYYNKTKHIPDPDKPSKKIQLTLEKKDRTLSDMRHAPIVDEEIFARAQEKFTHLSHMPATTRSIKSNYLLSGLLFCDTCKDYEQRRNGMVTRVGNKGGKSKQMYMCKGKASSNKKRCPCMPLPKDALENGIISRIKKLFKNPQIVRDYLEKSMFVKGRSHVIQQSLSDNLSQQQDALDQMEKLDTIVKVSKQYPIERYDQEKKELDKELSKLKYAENDLRSELSEYVEVEKYEESLELLGGFLKEKWRAVFEDRKKLRILLQLLVKRIVIYSEPKPDDFVVPGPKKEGQHIANRISIHFRLPQEMLNALYNQSVFLDDETEKDRAKRAMGFDPDYITNPDNMKFIELPHKQKQEAVSEEEFEKMEKKIKELAGDLDIEKIVKDEANPDGTRGPILTDDAPRPPRIN